MEFDSIINENSGNYSRSFNVYQQEPYFRVYLKNTGFGTIIDGNFADLRTSLRYDEYDYWIGSISTSPLMPTSRRYTLSGTTRDGSTLKAQASARTSDTYLSRP